MHNQSAGGWTGATALREWPPESRCKTPYGNLNIVVCIYYANIGFIVIFELEKKIVASDWMNWNYLSNQGDAIQHSLITGHKTARGVYSYS